MATKRTFSDLREMIISCLAKGKKTVNQISSETGINWKTVDNHLIYLVGKEIAAIVFSSPYVKIYELSETGKEYIKMKKSVKKSGGRV